MSSISCVINVTFAVDFGCFPDTNDSGDNSKNTEICHLS